MLSLTGSAVLGGGSNRLGDNGLGDERAGAVVYGNEHGVFRCGRDARENGFRAGLAAARYRAQLVNGEGFRQLGVGHDVLLTADEHDIADGGAFLEGGKRACEDGYAVNLEQQLVFAAHAAGGACRYDNSAYGGEISFFSAFSQHNCSVLSIKRLCEPFGSFG